MNQMNGCDVGFLSTLLGRDISLEKGGCKDYSDVYKYHVKDLHKILDKGVTMEAIGYTKFLLGENWSLRNSMTFVGYVVKEGMDFNYWLESVYKGG